MSRHTLHLSLILVSAAAALAACSGTSNSLTLDEGSGVPTQTGAGRDTYGETAGGGVPAEDEGELTPSDILDNRVVDYGAALRIASLKLVGKVPSLEQVKGLAAAADPAAYYATQIDTMLADPAFAKTQLAFWRNTFKSGGANDDGPSLEAAATFAAMTVVQDQPYTNLFTAAADTCPTYAEDTGFTAGSCGGNGPTVGVLTDPGLMAQYFAPLAFRRVRFIEETFVCSKLPVEYSNDPQPFGAGIYTGPYPVTSISGKNVDPDARIDFHDSTSTMCVNCHVTMNHAAPLFANFDDRGRYVADEMQVFLPDGNRAVRSDWLPEGEGTTWRFGKPTADLTAFGAAMAADPDVARCAVTRQWNYAFSRGNVVDDASPVPRAVSDALVQSFSADFKVKKLMRSIFTSDDFIRF